jgi:hypothetical protein
LVAPLTLREQWSLTTLLQRLFQKLVHESPAANNASEIEGDILGTM